MITELKDIMKHKMRDGIQGNTSLYLKGRAVVELRQVLSSSSSASFSLSPSRRILKK
jgi:hypothetical protein